MEFVYIDKTNNISDEDIIKDLLYVKNDILKKDTIIMKEYFQYGKYGKKAIINHFGTWNNLLDKLNIKKTRVNEHLTKEEIFSIIENLWITLQRQPNLREFESMTHHTKKIIKTNFDKWSNCLQQFVEWENKKGINSNIILSSKLKHKTPREPSKSLRYDVLKRDGFKCVICGKSPSTNPNIKLHVDHINPYSLGGETEINNLQTLCSECNLGKSNKKD